MLLKAVPKTSLQYYLINYDSAGDERDEADGNKTSQTVLGCVLKLQPHHDGS